MLLICFAISGIFNSNFRNCILILKISKFSTGRFLMKGQFLALMSLMSSVLLRFLVINIPRRITTLIFLFFDTKSGKSVLFFSVYVIKFSLRVQKLSLFILHVCATALGQKNRLLGFSKNQRVRARSL